MLKNVIHKGLIQMMFNTNCKKRITLFIFLVNPNISFSEWVDVAKLETGSLYLESKSIHRFDDVVEAVILQNLNESEQGSKSILSDVSYNCKKKLMTVMAIRRYPLHFAKGKLISFDTHIDGGWKINTPVPPNSRLFLQVCGKFSQLPNNK
jgi:hypothetical protein